MIQNAYNLENYFFVREQKKKRQTKTKQNRKEKGGKIAVFHIHFTSC